MFQNMGNIETLATCMADSFRFYLLAEAKKRAAYVVCVCCEPAAPYLSQTPDKYFFHGELKLERQMSLRNRKFSLLYSC